MSYARQGFHYNRNRLSQSNTTRDAENGSLISVGGGGRGRSVNNNGQRNPPPRAGGIQRFSGQNRIMALSQTDEQGGQEIMVDHAGGEFALSQETEITLTQALQEPDKKQQRSRSSGPKNDDNRTTSSQHRHLTGRTPRAMGGGRGTMVGRGAPQHHRASTPSNQKRRQMQQNMQLSQKKNHQRMNPNQPQRSMVGNNHHGNFTTPVAGSGRLLSSSKSVSSRQHNGLLLSQSMQEEDDVSTIQSRTLLTQESQGGGGIRFGGQRQQQSTKRSTLSSTPHNNGQQQQQQQRATMSMTSNNTQQVIPSLASSKRPASTAVRTLGGISNTLATLATPSKAFRSMTSFAARTAARTGATLGLTPRNFRSRAAMLSSSRLSSGARPAASGGVRMSTLSKPVGGANSVLVKRPEEEEDDADDASKVTQKTYDPNDEKDDGGAEAPTAQKEESAQKEAAANDEKKQMEDFLSKVQTAMDDKMKQFDEKLDEKFTEKKHELNEFFEKTAKTFEESVSKIEDIQQAMDAFPAKIASSTQEHGAQIRQLVAKSKEEMEKESVRVVESISSKARAVADDEAKKSIIEVVNNVIATAKGDFQVWTDGVLAGMRSSVIGDRRPVVAVSGEESTSEGPNDSIETEDCEVKERCQQSTVFSEREEWNKSDKENVLPDAEEDTTLSEEVNDVETNCSTVGTQFCADVQSGKWGDDDEDITEEKEEILKKGATPFSSKATPSTTTTPFSRKTTPVKNNYGKNRKSMQSSITAHDDDNNDEVNSEVQRGQKVQNDFGVAMSPHSKHVSSSNTKHTNRASPSSPQIPLKLSSGKKKRRNSPLPLSPRIGNRKVKSAKKAPKCESTHKINAKPPTKQKPPRYSQAGKDESTQSFEVKVQQKNSNDLVDKQPTTMKRKAPKKTDTDPRLSRHSETNVAQSKKSGSIPQLSQRSEKKQAENAPQIPQRSNKKRDQSIANVEKSTRRSKRLKESTRVAKAKAALKTRTEQAALKTKNKKAKALRAKQVTPVDDGARQLQSNAAKKGPSNTISSFHNPSPSRSNDDDHFDAGLHRYPANDVDELLGKELLVVAETSAAGDDSSGLDPDDGLLDKPKEKLFTPFQKGGRRSKKKSYGRKSKTAIAMHAENNKPKKADSVWSFKW